METILTTYSNKTKYYIASCSCGKDSLAMVLRLIIEHKPLDEIVFYDTGMEFSAIYRNWEKLKLYAELSGIKCTTLNPECKFLYDMLKREVKNRDGSGVHYGYSWCGGVCRWGTTAKLKALDKYCEERMANCYVGIAADELQRLQKERKPYKLFPLNEWGMTERDCLEYCSMHNVSWKENGVELYDILDRVSCWCCGNKNIWELYNIWRCLPEYWRKLKELQTQISRPFKKNYTIFDLEKKFENGYIPKHRNIKMQTMESNRG